MKFIYLLLIISLIVIFVFVYKSGLFDLGSFKHKQAIVAIRGERFQVDVADTLASRELGLGGREGLAADEGMLFVFGSLVERTFWMKDVGFSIDIIWIAGDRVVGFAENATPYKGESLTEISRYKSPEGVDRVLEVSAGTVKRVGIAVGDGVAVNFKD
ncbi:MAG: hypothetical protein UX77_C0005G0018 [Parcubacteria group bacterium GW2011_GWA1_47_11]|nr:MAG: hypothetical protein UX77_C0005G0018 [Parcubacteria group bacterium GW2011_GWA1_47_11]